MTNCSPDVSVILHGFVFVMMTYVVGHVLCSCVVCIIAVNVDNV